ncbi:MAG: hypothetical protein Q9219_007557 [cf. Caloplaca sp. 3 TL-2023]
MESRRLYGTSKTGEKYGALGPDLQSSDADHCGRFYYDAISWGGPWSMQLPVRSLVGLIPLYAVLTLEPELINNFPSFKRRLQWFVDNRNDVAERNIASLESRGKDDRLLLSLVNKERLVQILTRMLDENEFLSPYGIRSLSKHHENHPYSMIVNGQSFKVGYVPGDSDSGLFGGNSNWRGPIWLAVNMLLIESLLRFHMFYGNTLQVECPTGSGNHMHLGRVAEEIQHRLQSLFVRGDDGRRAINNGNGIFDFDEHWKDCVWFYEFFDANTGRGLGASHQCGWTGLIAKIIHDTGLNCGLPQTSRTPTAAAAHYFDDVFPQQGKNTDGQPRIRRSSTSRSIGNRSTFNSSVHDDLHGQPADDINDRQRRKSETNEHVARYITQTLERMRTNNGPPNYKDELETSLHDG